MLQRKRVRCMEIDEEENSRIHGLLFEQNQQYHSENKRKQIRNKTVRFNWKSDESISSGFQEWVSGSDCQISGGVSGMCWDYFRVAIAITIQLGGSSRFSRPPLANIFPTGCDRFNCATGQMRVDRRVSLEGGERDFIEHIAMLYTSAVGRFNWANATFWVCGENGAAGWLLADDWTSTIGCCFGAKRRSRRSPNSNSNAATSVCWYSPPSPYSNHFSSREKRKINRCLKEMKGGDDYFELGLSDVVDGLERWKLGRAFAAVERHGRLFFAVGRVSVFRLDLALLAPSVAVR